MRFYYNVVSVPVIGPVVSVWFQAPTEQLTPKTVPRGE